MDFEQRLERFYEEVLVTGDTCIDVGAHTGRHTLPMGRCVLPRGHVYAYEPLPMLVEQLRADLGRLEQPLSIDLFPYAISAEDGRAEFVVAVDSPAYSGLRERVYDSPTRLERIQVEVHRLDTLHADLPSLKYLKIDVEGGEWGVMCGAAGLIARLQPIISFEFGENSYRKYAVDPLEVHAFLTRHGYVVFDILGRELAAAPFAASSLNQAVWDYVAAPSKLGERIGGILRAIGQAPSG